MAGSRRGTTAWETPFILSMTSRMCDAISRLPGARSRASADALGLGEVALTVEGPPEAVEVGGVAGVASTACRQS